MLTAPVNDIKTLTYSSCPLCGSERIDAHLDVKDHSISGEIFSLWKCRECNFLFTQNPPTEAECSKYYESADYISHSDKKESITDRLYHLARDYMLGRKWKMVTQYSKKSGSGHLLDYGSGTGYFLNHAWQKGWQVEGIEISESARNFCKENFKIESNPPASLFTSTQKYDVITLWHVLEHLYDFHKYIDKFQSLLTDDGILVIAVPNNSSYDAAHYASDWAAYDVPRHLWHFTPKDFDHIARSHELQIVAKHGMPLDAFYVSILSQKYKTGRGLIRGGFRGMISNLKTIGNSDRYSSVIYVFKKA